MRVFPIVIVMALLAACVDGVQVSRQYIPQRGVPGHADYAAALGPVPVVMLNSPFPPAEVLAALRKNDPRRHQFTADPPASLDGGYRVVLAFDAMPAGASACRGPLSAAVASAGNQSRISVYGAFCIGPLLLSEAVATAPRSQPSTDTGLARLLGDLLSAVMPYRDPHDPVFDEG
jgi:hypothetical protein